MARKGEPGTGDPERDQEAATLATLYKSILDGSILNQREAVEDDALLRQRIDHILHEWGAMIRTHPDKTIRTALKACKKMMNKIETERRKAAELSEADTQPLPLKGKIRDPNEK